MTAPRVLLAAALLLAGSLPARAQDPGPAPAAPAAPAAPDAGRLREARARWDRLPAEEKARLRAAFEAWRALPQERRDEIRRRFERLGGREGAALAARRLEAVRRASPEHLDRLRVQAALVGRLFERVVEDLPARAAERWAALPPEARRKARERFARTVVAFAREAAVRRHATPEERAALEGDDAAARRAAVASLRRRIREEALAPHRAALEALPPEERRAREVRLLEEPIWAAARDRHAEIRAAFARVLLEEPGAGNGDRRPAREFREAFERQFGVLPEALGVPWAVRALLHELRARDAAARESFLAEARPELRRIAALPLPERDAALRRLLEGLR
jgi:hypothetical protein